MAILKIPTDTSQATLGYLLADGTIAMTGSFDMGSQSIINLGATTQFSLTSTGSNILTIGVASGLVTLSLGGSLLNQATDGLEVIGDFRLGGATTRSLEDAGGTDRVTLTNNGVLELKDEDGTAQVTVANTGNEVTVENDLEVKGATTLSGTAAITDKLTVTDDVLIDGKADAIQLRIQGHSTQTNDIFVVEKSDGTDLFTVDNAGDLTAVSYGGITEANLLDKSATETVSGAWTFSSAGTALTVDNNALVSGTLSVTGAGLGVNAAAVSGIRLTVIEDAKLGGSNVLMRFKFDDSEQSANNTLLQGFYLTGIHNMADIGGFADKNLTTFTLLDVDARVQDLLAGATLGTFTQLWLHGTTGVGTINTNYGLRIADLTQGTSRFPISQEGTGGNNLFAAESRFSGRVKVGADAAPASGFDLDVAGAAIVDSREVNRYAYSV